MLKSSAARLYGIRPITLASEYRSRSPFSRSADAEKDSTPKHSKSISRSRSPPGVLNHVHGKYVDAIRDKAEIGKKLVFIKRSVEEFSIRLDFILNCATTPNACMGEIQAFNEEFSGFVREECLSDDTDWSQPSAGMAYDRMREALNKSEERCGALAGENEALRDQISDIKVNIEKSRMDRPRTPFRKISASRSPLEDPEEEATRIRKRIDLMKQDLIEKQSTIEEMRSTHDAQVKKLDKMNREEINAMRDALSALGNSLEKWKTLYADDMARLREELIEKNRRLETFSPRRISTLSKTKSFEKL